MEKEKKYILVWTAVHKTASIKTVLILISA